jgi:hypothetical protein
MENRKISEIAIEIKNDWGTKVSPYAKPYLNEMLKMYDITDNVGIGNDSGKSMVLYFLSNAGSYRGETARRIKVELKKIVGIK